jgi:hypothetical protein
MHQTGLNTTCNWLFQAATILSVEVRMIGSERGQSSSMSDRSQNRFSSARPPHSWCLFRNGAIEGAAKRLFIWLAMHARSADDGDKGSL